VVTWYEILLFLHALAAALWLGGVATSLGLSLLARRAAEPLDAVRFGGWIERVGLAVYLPASLVLLATGFGLVEEAGWDYEAVFLQTGIVVWALAFVVGLLYLRPRARRLGALVDPADAARRVVQLVTLAWLELALLVVALFFMFAKPWD
jgi:hypothetical protein